MGTRMSDALLGELSLFVEVNMGLSFPPEKWADLEKGMLSVCRQFGFADQEIFARHVISSSLSKRQIEILASGLSVGETYFFREKNAFAAFEDIVLAKARSSEDRYLRIWSAGCSSGEEPYSIAMTLSRLLPYLKNWHITILATDINPQFLEKAARGVYTSWSFRDVPESIIRRFFYKKGGCFEILPEIKEMVSFSYHNLMKDEYPSLLNNTNAMDLIFCRNVLMYFSPETIKSVVHKFHRCLTDGGRLIISGTELNNEYFQEFEKVSQAGAMFFAKSDGKGGKKTEPVTDTPQPQKDITINPPLPEGEFNSEGLPYKQPEESPGNAADLSKMARDCANQGMLDDALRHIERAIAADTMHPGRHYLHAVILTEKGLKKEAMEALKKVVYLDADYVLAYFSMGNLARGAGNMVEAHRHFDSALLLLRRCGEDDILPESEGMTAGRLIDVIESIKWRKKERREN